MADDQGVPPPNETAVQRLVSFLIAEYQSAKANPFTTKLAFALIVVTTVKMLTPELLGQYTDAFKTGVDAAVALGLIQAQDRNR